MMFCEALGLHWVHTKGNDKNIKGQKIKGERKNIGPIGQRVNKKHKYGLVTCKALK